MEENKKQKGTSSSFTSELFGSKESSHPSSSSGIFGSIFSTPSPKVLGRESLRSEVNGKMASETWSSKTGIQGGDSVSAPGFLDFDEFSKGNDAESQNAVNKDMSHMYQDQRVHPCQLSSSIYYGGQDIYCHPQGTKNVGLDTLHKNDGGEDDLEIASRGNWWQGSLYY